MPRVKGFADLHRVTRCSRRGDRWEGISTCELIRAAGGTRPERASSRFRAEIAGQTGDSREAAKFEAVCALQRSTARGQTGDSLAVPALQTARGRTGDSLAVPALHG